MTEAALYRLTNALRIKFINPLKLLIQTYLWNIMVIVDINIEISSDSSSQGNNALSNLIMSNSIINYILIPPPPTILKAETRL